MIVVAKALSGGHVPVGAVLTRKWVFDKVFDRMDRAVVHGSTFSKNDLAMAAGIATLAVIKNERVIENAAAKGERLLAFFRKMADRYELVCDVRGRGLMIGVEFGPPKSLMLKARGTCLETGELRSLRPAHLHSAVQGPQSAHAGRRTRQSHHQAAAAAHTLATPIATGSKTLSTPSSRTPMSAFGRLVARQDARRTRDQGADERLTAPAGPRAER